jgi:hypothetical protein
MEHETVGCSQMGSNWFRLIDRTDPPSIPGLHKKFSFVLRGHDRVHRAGFVPRVRTWHRSIRACLRGVVPLSCAVHTADRSFVEIVRARAASKVSVVKDPELRGIKKQFRWSCVRVSDSRRSPVRASTHARSEPVCARRHQSCAVPHSGRCFVDIVIAKAA